METLVTGAVLMLPASGPAPGSLWWARREVRTLVAAFLAPTGGGAA